MTMTTGWKTVLALAAVCLATTGARLPAAEPKATEEVWEGTLKVSDAATLRMVLNVTRSEAGSLSATFDSPDQGASGLKVDSVTIDKTRLAFEMKDIGGKFEGKLNPAGTEATGEWSQGGMMFPLTLKKTVKPAPAPAVPGKEQIWEGKLSVGAGLQLRLVVHLTTTEAGVTVATFDSPDQGAKGLKVDSVSLDKKGLAFEMKSIGGKFEGKLNAAGTEAAGEWSQGPGKLPLTLKRTDKPSEYRRPQTPRPPFPYKEESVSYPNKAGGVTLAGALTVPRGQGPFPAVILISGSGAQDRDETLFEHKPFLVLADALTRRGVAVLRVDDRGVGGSTGSTIKSTSDDFAGDVLAGVAFLKTRPEIDAKTIGLIGHSEGGLIAPMAAARSGDVAFIVLLAGTGLPGDEILRLQARLIYKALGIDGPALDKILGFQKRVLEIARTETDEKAAGAKMREIADGLKDALPEGQHKALGSLDGLIDSQLKLLRSPWFRFFLAYDPRPTLAKVRCPVLALVGEKDLQVPPRENLAEIGKALKQAGNADVTLKEVPGVNHLFQTCTTGSPAEYAQIEETIAPSALAAVGDWIAERVGGKN